MKCYRDRINIFLNKNKKFNGIKKTKLNNWMVRSMRLRKIFLRSNWKLRIDKINNNILKRKIREKNKMFNSNKNAKK